MTIALILAGGIGSRAGFDIPKQYVEIGGSPVIAYTMKNLDESGIFDEIYVVCAEEWKDFVRETAERDGISSFVCTLPAGQSRLETMAKAIERLALNKRADDSLCIVDADRPMTPHRVLSDSVNALTDCDCVVTMMPCTDSVFLLDKTTDSVTGIADRTTMSFGQTPISTLVCHAVEAVRFSDTTSQTLPLTTAMMKLNKKIGHVKGSSKNIKITTSEDFEIVKAMILMNQTEERN